MERGRKWLEEWAKGRSPEIIAEGKLHPYAVGIPLLGEEVLFEVRSERIRHQPGDICLPGGAVEEGETPDKAVVRELTEELLIAPYQVRVAGEVLLLVSGSVMIHCFLIFLEGYEGTFSREEVSEVFTVPLSYFLETEPELYEVTYTPHPGEDFPYEKIHGGRSYPWRERKSQIRFYEPGSRVIWGLTARIMAAFADQLKRSGAGLPKGE